MHPERVAHRTPLGNKNEENEICVNDFSGPLTNPHLSHRTWRIASVKVIWRVYSSVVPLVKVADE
jgi:hypothetical protein